MVIPSWEACIDSTWDLSAELVTVRAAMFWLACRKLVSDSSANFFNFSYCALRFFNSSWASCSVYAGSSCSMILGFRTIDLWFTYVVVPFMFCGVVNSSMTSS